MSGSDFLLGFGDEDGTLRVAMAMSNPDGTRPPVENPDQSGLLSYSADVSDTSSTYDFVRKLDPNVEQALDLSSFEEDGLFLIRAACEVAGTADSLTVASHGGDRRGGLQLNLFSGNVETMAPTAPPPAPTSPPQTSDCPMNCAGNGECFDGVCRCQFGWAPPTCTQQMTTNYKLGETLTLRLDVEGLSILHGHLLLSDISCWAGVAFNDAAPRMADSNFIVMEPSGVDHRYATGNVEPQRVENSGFVLSGFSTLDAGANSASTLYQFTVDLDVIDINAGGVNLLIAHCDTPDTTVLAFHGSNFIAYENADLRTGEFVSGVADKTLVLTLVVGLATLVMFAAIWTHKRVAYRDHMMVQPQHSAAGIDAVSLQQPTLPPDDFASRIPLLKYMSRTIRTSRANASPPWVVLCGFVLLLVIFVVLAMDNQPLADELGEVCPLVVCI
jgi:hypothetical protein